MASGGVPYSLPYQSISKLFSRSPGYVDMADGEMLRRMVAYNERSTSSPFVDYPVELGHVESKDQVPEESLTPTATQTLKRSHWKNVAKADRCSDPKCQKKFTGLGSRKRNCCMCGEVFCRSCTRYRRKLSPDATPDPSLGVLCHVCPSCFASEEQEMGQSTDWNIEFTYFRTVKASSERTKEQTSIAMPIPALNTVGKGKRDRIVREMKRLTIGYESNTGIINSFMSEYKVPSWQKSSHWVEPSKSHQCQNCHVSFKMMARKINCRVCGQVYCTKCTKDEVILFIGDVELNAKWALNGKTGCPDKPPRSFTLVPVCQSCSKELENILIEEIEAEEDLMPEEEDFMDTLANLQNILYRSKAHIESSLPQYQKLVDSMDIVDGAPRSTHSKSPINDLARSQSNLSDQFSLLAIESQKLRALKPLTLIQAKVLKHVTIATYQFYSENMYMFRTTRQRLANFMPIESIERIQCCLNKLSIERVHILMRQITFEAMNLEIVYKLVSCNITGPLVNCVETLEEEMEAFFLKIGESWDKHAKAVSQMVREDYEGTNPEGKKRRRINIPNRIKKSPFRNVIVQHKILSQCSHFFNESLRELDAKTPESCFEATKSAIKEVCDNFDKQIAVLTRTNHNIFQ